MTDYLPIWVPPPNDPSWLRAATIARAFRAAREPNPVIVAGLVDSLAEAAWKAVIVGDHGQSFGPWQMKAAFYRQPILDGTGIDITDEDDLSRHVTAVLYALAMPANLPTLTAMRLSATGAAATRLWAGQFERASAGGAVERRVAIAPKIEVWLANLV